jgi:hypothetical protein
LEIKGNGLMVQLGKKWYCQALGTAMHQYENKKLARIQNIVGRKTEIRDR